MSLEIDFETRSDIDIMTCGAYLYFASPHTKPLMASYKLNGSSVNRWLPHEPCPSEIVAHVAVGGMVSAHNANFERQLWQKILTPLYGWPKIETRQFRCTLATASALGLPRKLERLGEALNLKVQKDKIGKQLINFFSKPRRPLLTEDPTGLYFNEPTDHPEKFEQFRAYCDIDVETESEADSRMIPLSADEQLVYTMDQEINDRGVRIDRLSCLRAIELVEKAKVKLDAEMKAVTGGHVGACSQVARLTEWAASRGVEMNGVAKGDILDALAFDDLPDDVRRALLIRQEAGKSSTSKLKAFLKRSSADDRVRGAFVYHGAAPGRWSSVGVNLGNMPRPRPQFEDADLDLRCLFGALRQAEPDLLKILYGDDLGRPLHLVSDAIRGFVWAAPGHEFLAVDYSNIQGAIAAWISGEQWKVDAMFAIKADPSLPDLYRRAAAAIMNTTTDVVTKKHYWRQAIGKTTELSLQFSGGVVAFHNMAINYGVNLNDIAEPVWQNADEEAREKAVKRYERCVRARDKVRTDILPRQTWIACEIVKNGWRATNSKISGAWDVLEDAMRSALQNPGHKFPALNVTYMVAHGFLFCRLPSDRCIAYAVPRLKDQVWAKLQNEDGTWPEESEVVDRELAERLQKIGKAKIDGQTKSAVTALGVDAQTQKLVRYAVYGGLAMENLCLAMERDIMVNGMRKAEAVGYPICMHNYDELVSERPIGEGDLQAFEQLVCELPGWTAGLPLMSHGWVGKRYRKA